MRKILFGVAFLLSAVVRGQSTQEYYEKLYGGHEGWEQHMAEFRDNFYKELNKYRRRKFLKPLTPDPALEQASLEWLKKMGKKMHHDPHLPARVGEVLTNSPTPLWSWQESKPHNRILLNKKARTIGFAFYNGVSCARIGL